MGEFTFSVAEKGVLCRTSGMGSYVVLRNDGTDFVPLRLNGGIVRVGGASTCVNLEIPGSYKILWPDTSGSCCGGSAPPMETPTFNYQETSSNAPLELLRTTMGDEQVALTDASISTLSPPGNATHAEVHVWSTNGCGAVWTVSGVEPDEAAMIGHRTVNGMSFELESADEITNFKASALSGCSVTLHVTYSELATHIE